MIKIITDILTALNLFEESAMKHAEGTQIGDNKLCNNSYRIIIKSISYLKANNELLQLIPYLNHSSVGVRNWAATFLLPIKENEAIKTLNDIADRSDIYSLDAETTLDEWRKGNLMLYP